MSVWNWIILIWFIGTVIASLIMFRELISNEMQDDIEKNHTSFFSKEFVNKVAVIIIPIQCFISWPIFLTKRLFYYIRISIAIFITKRILKNVLNGKQDKAKKYLEALKNISNGRK